MLRATGGTQLVLNRMAFVRFYERGGEVIIFIGGAYLCLVFSVLSANNTHILQPMNSSPVQVVKNKN